MAARSLENPPLHDTAPLEYCPITIAATFVAERWSLLIVRELMAGTHRFNEIHRALPGLSRTLLSSRLRHLERLGVLERRALDDAGKVHSYLLTPSGEDLRGVIDSLGAWAAAWRFPPASDDQSRAWQVLWRMTQSLEDDALPESPVSVEFRFAVGGTPRGWIRLDRQRSVTSFGKPAEMADLVVNTSPQVLHQLYFGHLLCEEALGAGLISFKGSDELAQGFRTWFKRSPFAGQVQRATAAQYI